MTWNRAVPKVEGEVRLEGPENLNKWRQCAQTILMRMFAVNWSGMIGSNWSRGEGSGQGRFKKIRLTTACLYVNKNDLTERN